MIVATVAARTCVVVVEPAYDVALGDDAVDGVPSPLTTRAPTLCSARSATSSRTVASGLIVTTS